MTTSTMNGMPRPSMTQRKSLNQQLDRLDQILDGLSDALNAAVVDAVRDAVGLAVQVALREVLTNPELVARLAPVSAATVALPAPTAANSNPTVSRPSLMSRLWKSARSRTIWLVNRFVDFVGKVGRAAKRTAVRFKGLARFSWTLMRYNGRTVVLALCVGVVAGTACYVAGPLVAAFVSGAVTAILAGLARILAPFTGALMMDVEV
jgi:hypothetical protein